MTEFRTLDDYFGFIARPGAVWMTSGERGGGKTHTAVAVAEDFIKGRYPKVGNVVVATNIIFYHKVHGEIRVETPPGVHYIRTMRDFFPIVVESIRTYGRDVLIMLILDEAQGFIAGDNNYTNASIPMKEFLGTIRKYNTMVWFLTPSAKFLGPAFRNLINGNPPGNVTCRWRKDIELNERWIAANKLTCTPKELMAVQPYDAPPMFLRVTRTEWTGTVDQLREGQYCYDHEAPATFREGEGFSFNNFNDYLGGVASIYAMDAIEEFYRTKVGVSEDGAPKPRSEQDIERESKAKLYSRLQINGMTQDEAARMVGVSRTTLNDWCRTMGLPNGRNARPPKGKGEPFGSLDEPEGSLPSRSKGVSAHTERRGSQHTSKGSPAPQKQAENTPENTVKTARKDGKRVRQKSGVASTFDDGRKGGSKSGRIYISRPEPSERGSSGGPSVKDNHDSRASEAPLTSSAPEGHPDARYDTPLPDGRYTMEEFRTATKWCTKEDR